MTWHLFQLSSNMFCSRLMIHRCVTANWPNEFKQKKKKNFGALMLVNARCLASVHSRLKHCMLSLVSWQIVSALNCTQSWMDGDDSRLTLQACCSTPSRSCTLTSRLIVPLVTKQPSLQIFRCSYTRGQRWSTGWASLHPQIPGGVENMKWQAVNERYSQISQSFSVNLVQCFFFCFMQCRSREFNNCWGNRHSSSLHDNLWIACWTVYDI